MAKTKSADAALPPLCILAALFSVTGWSSAFVGIRFALRDVSPGTLVTGRLAVASACFALLALGGKVRRPDLAALPPIVALALVGHGFYQWSLSVAETGITAGTASFLLATAPLTSALLSRAFLGDALPRRAWMGMALALTGVLATSLAGRDGLRLQPLALLGLGSAVATSVFFVGSKRLLVRYGAIDLTAYGVWVAFAASFAFIPGALASVPSMQTETILVLAYLGIVPTGACYALWSFALRRGPTGKVASFLYLQPLFTIAIAWETIGETPTAPEFAGGAAILAGVVVVAMSRD